MLPRLLHLVIALSVSTALGQPSQQSPDSEPQAQKALEGGFWQAASQGEESLPCYNKLISLLADDSAETRQRAAQCLSLIGSKADTTAPHLLRMQESDPDPLTRGMATFALAMLARQSGQADLALPRLIEVVDRNDNETTGVALRALALMGSMAEPATDAIVRAFFVKQQGTAWPTNCIDATNTLVALRPRPDVVLPRFSDFVSEGHDSHHRDEKRVDLAFVVIASYGEAADPYAEVLVAALHDPIYQRDGTGYEFLARSLRTLVGATQRMPDSLLEATRDPVPAVRADASQVLGVLCNPADDIVIRLRELAREDPVPCVRAQAAGSLIECEADVDLGWRLLREIYDSDDPVGKFDAIRVMGRLPRVADRSVPILMSELERMDPRFPVQLDVCKSLGSLGTAAAPAIPMLQRCLVALQSAPELNRDSIECIEAALKRIQAPPSGP